MQLKNIIDKETLAKFNKISKTPIQYKRLNKGEEIVNKPEYEIKENIERYLIVFGKEG
jgi:hypothetical protein